MTYLKFLSFFLIVSFFSNSALSKIEDYKPQFQILTPFITNSGNGQIQLKLYLKPGYKAYVDQFKLSAKPWLNFSKPKVTPNYILKDPFSKKNKSVTKGQSTLFFIYENLKQWPKDLKKINLSIEYQICTKKICYLKQTQNLYILIKNLNTQITSTKKNLINTTSPCESNFFSLTCLLNLDENILLKKMNSILNKKNWGFLLLILFITGLLMSFTPCILPMIPITLSIIGAQKDKNLKDKLITTSIYSLGISLTYASMGVLAALTGSLFGSVLSNPYIQFIFSSIFFLSALSLFGLFSIQGPSGIFQKYNFIKNPNLFHIFILGLIAGLIASPCIGPVLLGVLSFVTQSQDPFLGFILLFTLAQGLNFSLILISLTGSSWIKKHLQTPKVMYGAKTILGTGFLLGSFYFAYPLLSPLLNKTKLTSSKTHRLWKEYTSESFKKALKTNKPIVVDFYADWCLACLELNTKVFSSKNIQDIKSRFVWLQVNATNTSPQVSLLQKKYKVLGLPTLLFFSKTGILQKDLRLTGFENKKKFKKRLKQLLNKK